MGNFDDALKFGKTGEGYLARYLIRSGFNVLPVYEIEQGQYKGPSVYSSCGRLVAPDMMAFSSRVEFEGEKCCFLEAKTKSAFTWHRITQRFTTGISRQHFYDYLKIQQNAPFTVWLMFLQLDKVAAKDSPHGPSGLYGASVEWLSRKINHEHIAEDERKSMVYWAEQDLRYIASLDEVANGVYTGAPHLQVALL
jgi:hypothetical protein